jgi:cysteinyl-tRNA synthetase
MSLTIYNTLSRTKEEFSPIDADRVKMYCCGVTVYDYCHLGHGRAYIVWDTVRRYLQWRGYQVQYIQNFTDIDDKILNRAKSEKSSMAAVSEKFTVAYFEDLRKLGVVDADVYPKATEHIPTIIDLIERLVEKEFAYPANGDVYFRVRKFEEYGKLSHRNLDDMKAGASERVNDGDDRQKEDPFDFALWKAAKPGEPSWDSPWGKGRPGWHIECSAMIRSVLGETIDIHCGGGDLVFPHHENEIAQSECAHDAPLSKYWMHNGMVTVDGTKMSKSLGNFTTIRDLLNGKSTKKVKNKPENRSPVAPMAVRLFVLTAQYRKPIDFTDSAISAATQSWKTIEEGLSFGYEWGDKLDWDNLPSSPLDISGDLSGELVDVEVVTAGEQPLPQRTIQAVAHKTAPAAAPELTDSLQEVVAPFTNLPQDFRQFFQEYRGLVLLAVSLFFTQFPARFLFAFFGSFNSTLPIVSRVFQALGVAFFLRYLISRSWRDRVQAGFAATKQTILGEGKSSPALASAPSVPVVAAPVSQPPVIKPLSAVAPVAATPVAPTPKNDYIHRFQAAVDDDFNFAEGLAVVFELAKELRKVKNILVHEGNTTANVATLKMQWQTLIELAGVLGLSIDPQVKSAPTNGLTDGEIEALLEQRQIARKNKDFAESDRLRDELKAQGITVVDKPGAPSTWHR